CMQGYADLASMLISAGANVDYSSQDGSTPLHIAAKEGKQEVVQLLLDSGANPNLRDSSGKRPVDLANADLKQILKGSVFFVFFCLGKIPALTLGEYSWILS